MSEVEKQEGQKTVVAFIAGLLIGGLLVWVFSSTPETTPSETPEENGAETTTEGTDDTDANGEGSDTNAPEADGNGSDEAPAQNGGEDDDTGAQSESGSLVVADQAAGGVVVLDSITYAGNEGWIAVRDYVDGVAGSVLGAARYEVDAGLTPSEVLLLRDTTAGNEYQVIFYTESGDEIFDPADDVVIEGSGTVFVAE